MINQKYSVALLTSNERNKTTSAVAREMKCSQSTLSKLMQSSIINKDTIIRKLLRFFGKSIIYFVIDDTVISKRYANPSRTEGLASMIDHSSKTFTQGLCILVGAFTNGQYLLPVTLKLWVSENLAKNEYLTKAEMAAAMIKDVETWGINIFCYILDGGYFSEDLIRFFVEQNLRFIMKAKTTTTPTFNNKEKQLQMISELRLNSNQNCKKIRAPWKGMRLYFIAIRRITRKGNEEVIFVVANFACSKTSRYAQLYDARWGIEKFFRTGKQHLGLKDSQAQTSEVYLNHMQFVMNAYVFLQFIRKHFKLATAEDALKLTRAWKKEISFNEINDRISLLVNYA